MPKTDSGVKSPKKTRKKSFAKKITGIFIVTVLVCLVAAGLILGWSYIGKPCIDMYVDAVEKVSESSVDTFKASQTSLVYDSQGKEILTLKGEKDVYYLDYEEIPDAAKLAMISIEDKKFVYHRGVDVKGTIRAAVVLVLNRGQITQGGSSITQQLAKNIFLTHEKSWERKVEEIFIATMLEKKYSKEQILEFYLNNIYFANGYYGIQAASQGYFGRNADELSLSEIAFLCAIPNGPTMYNPLEHKDNTIKRRNKILKNMLQDEYISQDQYDAAVAEEITVKKARKKSVNDYVETYVLKCATEALMMDQGFEMKNTFATDSEKEAYTEEYNTLYDTCLQSLYTGGYRIYTSIDMDMQNQLQTAVNEKLSGFTEKTEDDTYKVQGSATCIDNRTGRVVAVVGGRKSDGDATYTLNRAYQTYRQPGSAIKPLLVFTPILERGMNPYSTVDDSRMKDGEVSNSGGNYSGRITLRRAVQKSSNVVTYRLYEELTPEVALSYLEKMNFKGLEPEDYEYMTTCLGGFTRGTNTVEMAAAFATIENKGVYRNPTCIVKITKATGEVVVEDDNTGTRIYQKEAAQKMTDILQSVVDSYPGTARGCKLSNQPAAAKTGTTTSNTDGWLCGYTPYYTTAVWVGQDQVKTVYGLSGSSYPAYIWKTFMSEIHSNLERMDFPTYDGQTSYDPYYAPKTTEASTTATDASTEDSSDTTADTTGESEVPVTDPTTEATQATTEAPADDSVEDGGSNAAGSNGSWNEW